MTEPHVTEKGLPCPNCTSSDAYTLYSDGHGYCFSCGKDVQTNPEKEEEVDQTGSYQYLQSLRGVTRKTFQHFGVEAYVDASGKPVYLRTPFNEGGVQKKYLDKKSFPSENMKGPRVFGLDKFEGGAKKITITEGALDAMSVFEMMGNWPVMSIVSSGSAVRDITSVLDTLNKYEEIILCFDSDEQGRKATEAVHGLFPHRKVKVCSLTKYNDPNEYLQNNDVKAFRDAWWSSAPLQRDDILSSYDNVLGALNDDEAKESVDLPFPKLNKMLWGLRRGDVVLVTAQEGIGKTEVLRSMEHYLLTTSASPETNIGILHLEEDKVRSVKGLAGYELQIPLHLPTHSMSNSDILDTYKRVTQRDNRLHIFTHFGSDSIEDILSAIRYLAASCECKYIFFDHITMVVTGSMEDQTKGLDYLSTQLKMLAKELDFCLVLVSHVNDNGQTRGSRNIGKIADSRISLQRDILSEDEETRNTTRLMVEKNRWGAVTGPADSLLFNPNTFCLEVKEDPVPDANEDT